MRRRKPDEDKDKKKQEGAEKEAILCSFCREHDDPENLITPCHCRTIHWHYECLVLWIRHIQDLACSICNGRYTDSRIRRGSLANRLQFYRDDPVLAVTMAITICLMGLIFGIIYLIVSLNGFNLSNISVIEYFTIAFLFLMIYGAGYGINVADGMYRDSAGRHDVIWFLNHDGQHEVPAVNGEPVVYQYLVGEDRHNRQLGEQQRMAALMEQENAIALAQQMNIIELEDPTDDEEDDDELPPFFEQ